MKLSAFCVITKPDERQDPWRESILSVAQFVDEVVVVCGDKSDIKLVGDWWSSIKNKTTLLRLHYQHWPYIWDWSELPKHLQTGLANCSGDWAIRFDVDYIFGERDGSPVDRQKLVTELKQFEDKGMFAATFQKMSFVINNKFYEKGGTIIAINKNAQMKTDEHNLPIERIVIGKQDKYTDLCVPVIAGQHPLYSTELKSDKFGVFVGRAIPEEKIGKAHTYIWNYDYTFKTKEFTEREFLRFSEAHKKYFGESKWGDTKESALKVFIDMMKGRLKDCPYQFKIEEQPELIRERVQNLSDKHFGYNGWGLL